MFSEEEFAANLRAERARRKLTLQDVADAVGLSKQGVSAWERGVSNPDFTALTTLAEMYGMTTDELLGFVPTAEPVAIPPVGWGGGNAMHG